MRTPPQCTFFTVQPVTQWKVEIWFTRGSARSCSYVSVVGCSTWPPIVSRHVTGSNVGIEPETV